MSVVVLYEKNTGKCPKRGKLPIMDNLLKKAQIDPGSLNLRYYLVLKIKFW